MKNWHELNRSRLTAVLAAAALFAGGTALRADDTEIRGSLSAIYTTLMHCKQNYDGHRAAAMREIREGAAPLNLILTGVVEGNPTQEESDNGIVQAEEQIRELSAQLTSDDQQPLALHLQIALRHLALGLAAVTADPVPRSLPIAISPEDASALQLAYAILAPGNGNYNSHRAAAMAKIELAARLAGIEVSGTPGGSEDQGKSDARMTLALKYLTDVRSHLTAPEQRPMLKFLDAAMQRIQRGLEYRAKLALPSGGG